MRNIRLTIGLKLVLAFLAVALLVAIVGFIGTRTAGNMRQRFELATIVDDILVRFSDRDAAIIEAINSIDLEEYKSFKKEVEDLDMEIDGLNAEIRADFDIETVPGLVAFIVQDDFIDRIEHQLFQTHEERLTQQVVFAESYLLEKSQRYDVRTPIIESNDPSLIIAVANMQYFSKEALFQYGDQQHVDEWLESINIASQMVSSPHAGLSPETTRDVLNQIALYQQTAEEMGRIVVRENEILAQEAQLKSDLRTLRRELGNLRNQISVELNESIGTSFDSDRQILVGSIVVTVVLAMGVGLVISRSIAGPINALTNMAQRISGGDLNAELRGFNGKDEIGVLASTFNDMTSALRAAHDGMEQKVWELEETQIGLENEITVRKQAEATLEHRAIELDAVNQELESFSYSVSHDLRAPLRSIDGFGQALLEDYSELLDAQGKDYLQRMRAASRRMGESIDGLLNLSRVTRSEIRRQKVDLSVLVQAVAAELQATQPLRRAKFVIQEGIIVNGDAQLLRAVLDNLLSNAWKFTGSRDLTKIEFGVTSNGAGPVYFVRDDGVGFDMAYVDKLFGAFQRLHAVTAFEGMGIGLATVKRIVHRHGGQVWAEGETGVGATFYFTLN